MKFKDLKFKPIEDYKQVFFGDGKIVFLLYNSLKFPFRGGSALRIHYTDDEGYEAVTMPRIMLYLPLGKKLEDGLYIAE